MRTKEIAAATIVRNSRQKLPADQYGPPRKREGEEEKLLKRKRWQKEDVGDFNAS